MPQSRKRTSNFTDRVKRAAQMTAEEQNEQAREAGQNKAERSKSARNTKPTRRQSQSLRIRDKDNKQSEERTNRKPSSRRGSVYIDSTVTKRRTNRNRLSQDNGHIQENTQKAHEDNLKQAQKTSAVRYQRGRLSTSNSVSFRKDKQEECSSVSKHENANVENVAAKSAGRTESPTRTMRLVHQRGAAQDKSEQAKQALRKTHRSYESREFTKRKVDKKRDMQAAEEQKTPTAYSVESIRQKVAEKIPGLPALSQKTMAIAISIVLVLILCGAIYPVSKTYYTALRTEQRQNLILEAEKARNEELSKANKNLQTEEGIENEARKSGYVKKGETSVSVTNVDEKDTQASTLPAPIDESKIHAPQTWYYKILDVIFFVDA